LEQSLSKTQLGCFHCGEQCLNQKIKIDNKYFCCEGCKMVYEILNQNELCSYYDLNNHPGITQKINIRADKFSFLDDAHIVSKLIQFSDGKQTNVSFYLPQMHCSSCLWLLENIHRINPGVISSRVNFAKKEVFLVYNNSQTTLRKVVETLTSIGYEPHISLQDAGTEKPRSYDRTRMLKIGVAGFCFANIMMLSVPEYFSVGGFIQDKIGTAFRYINLILALPVFFYCSTEFFKGAWKGITHKFLNIDAPIALAILITFGRSLYEMFVLNGNPYFDSMSGIVFLMLVGRWAQDKTQQAIAFDRDFKSFFPIAVNVQRQNGFTPILIQDLKENDVIEIFNNELIPADAILSKGKAEIDYSFVSGESLPVIKDVGEIIYAGGKQLGERLELIIIKKVSQSYLTNLWNKDVFNHEKKESKFLHILSNYFTLIIFIISTIAAAYWLWRGETRVMWNVLTTILIIACPCALLLSATFTNGNILRVLSRNKFYLRHPNVIEDISHINHLVFDKTGTITQSRKLKVSYTGNPIEGDKKMLLASLLKQSTHPLSKAIFNYLNVEDTIPVNDFKNIPGQGIEGWVNETYIKAGSREFINNASESGNETGGSKVAVKIEQEVVGEFTITNSYRFGFSDLMERLEKNYRISILSGDNDSEAGNLQKILRKGSEMLFNQSPEEKLEYVKYLQDAKKVKVMMIGDGLNDSGALMQSNVGIALSEQNNNFTPAADGIFDAGQFSSLYKFLSLARAGRKIIMTSFIISVIYNIVGIYFAVQGLLSPMISAVLMPASSISIILITFGMTEIYAKRLNL
jgi:P-type Cu+ transporter